MNGSAPFFTTSRVETPLPSLKPSIQGTHTTDKDSIRVSTAQRGGNRLHTGGTTAGVSPQPTAVTMSSTQPVKGPETLDNNNLGSTW